MKVLTLRTELETLLSGLLGTYTLANGYKTPAISVRPEGAKVLSDTHVEGLEVVITEEPVLRPIRQYRNEAAFNIWTVDLLLWGSLVTEGSIADAAAYVLAAYPGCILSKPSVASNTGVRARHRIEIITNPDPS